MGFGAEFSKRLGSLVEIGTLLVGVATVGGFFGGLWFGLDLMAHFRLQYCVLFAAAGAVSLLHRKWWLAGTAGILIVPNLVVVAPYLVRKQETPNARTGEIRVVTFNLNTANTQHRQVADFLKSSDADIIFLMEASDEWVRDLESVADAYSHKIVIPQDDNFGLILLSKIPITRLETKTWGGEVPSALMQAQTNGRSFCLIGTHPPPPMNRSYAAIHDRQLVEIAKEIKALAMPVILMGDLNATPWSASFKDLVKTTGLVDFSMGRGWHPTWKSPFYGMAIPIDHVLTTPGITIVSRTRGPDLGSDHYPILFSFDVR